jgi:tRNA(fMet)-specific endonuclease VapC
LGRFLLPLEILPYDENAARAYGKIRPVLERGGRLIGSMDMLIAAHALSLQATLVTHNRREFQRVPGLKVEDWTGK